jgi:uncharacterized protein (TIGR02147 family)
MAIFDYKSYKAFVLGYVSERPKKGHGEFRKMAQAIGVSTTMISLIFKSDKHLNLELANDLCEYLGLNDKETEYFFLLVQLERAGSHRLRTRMLKQVEAAQSRSQKLKERLVRDKDLSETDKAIFYSSWIYSGLRNFLAANSKLTIEEMAQRLNVPRLQIQKALDFLVETGLIRRAGNSWQVEAKRTHIGSDSPLVTKHHQNWRLQGFNKMPYADESNLFFTSPMSLSKKAAEEVRKKIPSFIQEISKVVVDSKSEVVRCLNIDWFEY